MTAPMDLSDDERKLWDTTTPDGTYRELLQKLSDARAALRDLNTKLGMQTAYPFHSILSHLVDAADHLFDFHNCDTSGWEVLQSARDHGRAMLATLAIPAPVAVPAVDGRIYPCADCGVMRSKAEGGTTFTVCDACWDKAHP